MMGFKIVALTKVGTDALDQCIQEEKVELSKKGFLERLKFNKVWIRKTTRNPLTDVWQVHPDAVRFMLMDPKFSIKGIMSEVRLAMTKNGAEVDRDFYVEELEGDVRG